MQCEDITLKERRVHGTELFPCGLYQRKEDDPLTAMQYHWHDEIEIIYFEFFLINLHCDQIVRMPRKLSSANQMPATRSKLQIEILVSRISSIPSENDDSLDPLLKWCKWSIFHEAVFTFGSFLKEVVVYV